jgi:hypothetical protein
MYIVTYQMSDPEIVLARDEAGDLESALERARRLLLWGHHGVAIQDTALHQIAGYDLAACCRGDKTLTADLRAV